MFNRKSSSPGYQINKKKDEQEIYIYDEIGSPGGFWGVDPEQFAKDLKAITGPVKIRINSPGGSVFGGMSIYNAIQSYEGGTTTIVDGLAASAASYIALAGDTVKINQGAFLMINEAWSLAIGNASDLRKEADLLDKIDGQIAGFYARKTGKELSDIQDIMTDETWFTADEALEFGLVDEVIEKTKPAENLFDLSVFNNVPDALNQPEACETQKPKDWESALRDAGMSRREAKAVLAEGLKALNPESENEPYPVDNEMEAKKREFERMQMELDEIFIDMKGTAL
jgi:ATP-dependent Clp endopeptidase proteolytic subunit ClpP